MLFIGQAQKCPGTIFNPRGSAFHLSLFTFHPRSAKPCFPSVCPTQTPYLRRTRQGRFTPIPPEHAIKYLQCLRINFIPPHEVTPEYRIAGD
jgi:hypothetical protein